MIEGIPMTCVQSSSRSSNQDGIGHHLLQSGRRGQNSLQGLAQAVHLLIISDKRLEV